MLSIFFYSHTQSFLSLTYVFPTLCFSPNSAFSFLYSTPFPSIHFYSCFQPFPKHFSPTNISAIREPLYSASFLFLNKNKAQASLNSTVFLSLLFSCIQPFPRLFLLPETQQPCKLLCCPSVLFLRKKSTTIIVYTFSIPFISMYSTFS